MILIKITKETREPEAGEWVYNALFNTAYKITRDTQTIYAKALSLSVILDAPKYWNELSKNNQDAYAGEFYPISNSVHLRLPNTQD